MIDPKIPLPFKFQDERGTIQNLVFHPINSVALITSKKGTTRSNHYHNRENSGHYIYVLSGKMNYLERNLDGSDIKDIIVEAGEMVFTGSRKVHRVDFLEDSVIISMNLNERGPENDAEDTVHMKF